MDSEGKPIEWLGSSLDDLRDFPPDVRRQAGFQLERVQHGLLPNDWKPMTAVGSGVVEIRIRSGREHRVLYISKFAEAVYVLHVFEKKSQRTAAQDISIGNARYRELLNMRRVR